MDPEPDPFDEVLPLFPLPEVVLLPHTVLPLHVFEPRYVEMVEDAARGRGLLGLVFLEPGFEADYFETPPVRRIGCAGRITDLEARPGDRYDLKLEGVRKFEILEEVGESPYRRARVRWLVDRNENARGEKADLAVERLAALLDDSARARGDWPVSAELIPAGIPFAGKVNALCAAARLDADALQGLLELRDVYARARRLARILEERRSARERAARYRPHLPEDPAAN